MASPLPCWAASTSCRSASRAGVTVHIDPSALMAGEAAAFVHAAASPATDVVGPELHRPRPVEQTTVGGVDHLPPQPALLRIELHPMRPGSRMPQQVRGVAHGKGAVPGPDVSGPD